MTNSGDELLLFARGIEDPFLVKQYTE